MAWVLRMNCALTPRLHHLPSDPMAQTMEGHTMGCYSRVIARGPGCIVGLPLPVEVPGAIYRIQGTKEIHRSVILLVIQLGKKSLNSFGSWGPDLLGTRGSQFCKKMETKRQTRVCC